MSNLSFFTHEFGDYEIRVVGDGRFSVYDVLVAFGAYPNLDTARITFRRLEKQNPEVSDFCSDFKFPGRGQRETPVTDEEGMYRLMLCPGKRGAEFRKWAAGIITDVVTFHTLIISAAKNEKDVHRLMAMDVKSKAAMFVLMIAHAIVFTPWASEFQRLESEARQRKGAA